MSAIVPFVNRAYRGDSSRKGWTTEADLLAGQRVDERMLHEMIEAPRSAVLLMLVDTQSPGAWALRACVQIKMLEGTRAYLGLLTVDPDSQAQSHGKKMLVCAEEFCRDTWSATEIVMTVIDSRVELIAWYERRGYVRTGKRLPFPMHDLNFGLPLVEKLEFVELAKRLDHDGEPMKFTD